MIGFGKEKGSDNLMIRYKGNEAGLVRVILRRPGNDWYSNPCVCLLESVANTPNNVYASWNCPEEDVRCTVSLKKDGNVLSGTYSAEGSGCVLVSLVWELPAVDDIFPFIPAFMYGTNKGGGSFNATYPKLVKNAGRYDRPWESEEWLVRADRSSHCFTSVISGGMTFAVGGSDVSRYPRGDIASKNGLGISVTEPARLTYSLGYVNHPYTYSTVIGRNSFTKPDGYIDLDKGTVSSPLFMIISESSGIAGSASMLLHKAYELIHDVLSFRGDIGEAAADIAGALADYGYDPEARNFLVARPENERIMKKSMLFNTAWAGGLTAAYPLLAAGILLDDRRLVFCAEEVLDNIADNSISMHSGLFNENYDLKNNIWNAKGWWYGMLEHPGHSAYVNGQAAYFLLLSWELANARGRERLNWRNAAFSVMDRVMARQDERGCFGYIYSETDGRVIDREGFCGCWMIPPLVMMHKISGDVKYLDSARKAMTFYRKYVYGYDVFGCPHDTFKSPDEEGILAWVEASRLLHELTGGDEYLNDLLTGLEYEFSWKFGYNVQNEAEPLRSMKWSSAGGSATSVNNSHIHPMGSSILYSILYAWRNTKDRYYLSRLNDTLGWSLQAYNRFDGQYGWGRKGMINERFCYTDSLLTERFADGSPSSVWFCYHSWAAGSVLEGLVSLLGKLDEDEKKLIYCLREESDK